MVQCALTLVGERGQRLKPITDTFPKSMAPLNGRPIVEAPERFRAATSANANQDRILAYQQITSRDIVACMMASSGF